MKPLHSTLLVIVLTACFVASDAGAQTARVIGGVSAAPNAWTFPAYVLIDNNFQCGGSLVAPRFVLTAGHCAKDPDTLVAHDASSYLIRLGSTESNSGGEVHHVVRVIPHEQFGKDYPLENDIALLELDTPTSIRPVVLDGMPQSSMPARLASSEGTNPWAKILGWGRTNPDPTVSSLATNLKEASIAIVDNKLCQSALQTNPLAIQNKLSNYGPIDERRLCAGESQGGIDTCNGDSGGPIVEQSAAKDWVQVGIVSYGVETCGSAGVYGVYTRVSAFRDWLGRNLSVEGPAPGPPPGPPPVVPVSPITSAPTIIEAADRNDGQVRVDVLPGAQFHVGEPLRIRVTSAFSGTLLVLDLGEDGKITQLFPNQYSRTAYADGRIRAGGSLTLPDPTYGFALTTTLAADNAQERNRIIAVVAENGAILSDLTRSQDGFAAMSSDRLARLEVVLKQQTGPSNGGTAGRWAAGEQDYIVDR